jgi:hypothetical protein
MDHTKNIKKMGLQLHSGEEMTILLKNAGFENIVIDYFEAVKVPLKGYLVPKGMVVTAIKK